MALGMGEVIPILFLSVGITTPILFWVPGLVEIIIILLFLACLVAAVIAVFYFIAKRLTIIGGKTCPHCAERIKKDAKVCRYCQRDVTGV